MFSWATSTFESLAQTVAPPPSDPPSKIYHACQRKDETGTIELLQQNGIDPIHAIIFASKGYTTVHLACLYSLPHVLQYCIDQSLPFLHVLDHEGNTPLHCAAMSNQSNALDIIKLLISIDPSSVVVANRSGQTPYDVANLNTVRQHLLPLQLQAETQRALDNGGVGLPPGIDLGGLKIANPNLAPPPIMPTMNGGPTAVAGPSSVYPTTPGIPPSMPYPPSSAPASIPPYGSSVLPTSLSQPPLGSSAATTSPSAALGEPGHIVPTEAASISVESSIPRPPTSNGSHSYALTGRSSAATLKTKAGIQPDGFHSSSSDKNLQEKYGHVAASNNPAVPPPPSSGNFPGILEGAPAGGGIQSAPPSMTTNPFAGGLSTLGAAAGARASARRYVAYDPGQTNRSNRGPYNTPPAVAAPAPYTPYNSFASQPVQPLASSFTNAQNGFPVLTSNPDPYMVQPTPPSNPVTFMIPQQTSMNTSFVSSPPPANFGKTPANTPMTAAAEPHHTSLISPPPSGITTSAPSIVAPRSFASSTSPDRSSGTLNAASVFGTTPVATPGYHRSSSAPMEASSLFSRPPSAPVEETAPVDGNAASIPRPGASSAAELFGKTPSATAVIPDAAPVDMANEEEDLDDVPLSPGPEKECQSTEMAENQGHPPEDTTGTNQPNETASLVASGVTSLIAAIGMPPPPFSKK
jgi:Ankyrin repeats (3 copies)